MTFMINRNFNRRLFVVDNFYASPHEVRDFALKCEFKADIRWYKGLRSTQIHHPPGIRHAFEDIIGQPIDFCHEGVNGCFQITTSEDQQVYHFDQQKWAAMIYLSPNAPIESGTRTHMSKVNGARHMLDGSSITDVAFAGGFYDSTKFETIDSIGYIFNRLVIMDAQHIHSAGSYFGSSPTTGRLTHLFFFN